MSAEQAHAIRDGDLRTIPASELVPGDLILIEAEDIVPTDARIVELSSLQTSEAALTGESLPVLKDYEPITGDVALGDRINMVFKGTSVTSGRGTRLLWRPGCRPKWGASLECWRPSRMKRPFVIGAIMAIGSLYVLDADLPGGRSRRSCCFSCSMCSTRGRTSALRGLLETVGC